MSEAVLVFGCLFVCVCVCMCVYGRLLVVPQGRLKPKRVTALVATLPSVADQAKLAAMPAAEGRRFVTIRDLVAGYVCEHAPSNRDAALVHDAKECLLPQPCAYVVPAQSRA